MRKKGFTRRIIAILSWLTGIVLITGFLGLIVIGSYVIWDTNKVLEPAMPKAYELYKPVVPATESFEELQRENPDVIAWLSLYGTNVDYPVVQSKIDNWT